VIALHCDNPSCNAWQREPYDSFLLLAGHGGHNHFCSVDCVMFWAAQFEPKETIGA